MKIIPGAIVGKISGSLGGMTAAHGRGGYYLRNRVKPVNPNTPRQQNVRSALGALVQGWSSLLTPAQRAGWIAYADATPRTDRLGESLILTGMQAYVACNTPRLQVTASGLAATLPRIDDAPTVPTLGEPVTGYDTAVYTAGPPATLAIDFDFAVPTSEGGDLLIYVGSRLMSAGQRSYTGPYQLAAVAAVSNNDTTASTGALELGDPDDWAAGIVPTAGDVIAVRAQVTYDDGRLSQEWTSLLEIT